MEQPISVYNGIVIDYSRDKLLPEKGLAMLTAKGFYKKDSEDSPQQSFARAATCYCFGDYEFAQRIYDAASKHWFTFASPVLSNAVDVEWPTFTEDEWLDAASWLQRNVEPDGMPISCFLVKIPDNKKGIVEARTETAWLSMMGGGVGVYAANRSPDEKSTGVMSHLRGYDADTLSYRQTASRRGSIAAYADITHPEIQSFIQMRNPVGGDANKKCFNLNNAVNLPDSFMEAVINERDYELIDPKHGPTGRKLNAAKVFEEVLEMRFETGEPYLHFVDTSNRCKPKQITNPLYKVEQSNLCSEVTLMTSDKRTAVCCLSSLNLEKYDEWKDSGLVKDLVRLLDNVLEYFIRLAPPVLSKAVYSASMERSIGIGTLGWHSYLQKHMIPFESGGFDSAAQHTSILYSSIKQQAEDASKELAITRGEAQDCVGSGFRNAHLLAIAPNASSADIVGASPSVEPWAGNAFNNQGRAGSFLIKNKYLEKELDKIGLNTKEVWDGIIANEGSCQHLAELDDHTKKVFKTAREINPMWIIELASLRQQYVCQSQSINIFVPEDITMQEMADVHIVAWKKGLKSLYYCRAKAAGKVSVGTGGETPLNSIQVRQKIEWAGECLSCEG
jgi:ribonucleoside-diphosphate reductase alpha chain